MLEENINLLLDIFGNLKMNNDSGMREILDCWEYHGYSWAIILYPNGILKLQWLNLNKC